MAIPYTQVVTSLSDPSGDPVVGATITAELSSYVVYENVIVPSQESVTTDDTGSATLALVPNNLGGTNNTYTFTINHESLPRPLIYYEVVVPESASPVTLASLLGWSGGGPTAQVYWSPTSYWTATNYWF